MVTISKVAPRIFENSHRGDSADEECPAQCKKHELPSFSGENSERSIAQQSSDYGFKVGQWEFNSKVTANWEFEMCGHIPDRDMVLDLCADIVSRSFSTSAKILVYWAAQGASFKRYMERGWEISKLKGINYSKPLHDALLTAFPGVTSILVDVKDRPANPCAPLLGGRCAFEVVHMPWSLHFEAVEDRLRVLQHIFAALLPGGILLLSEKTRQPGMIEEMYHKWKRDQGVPEYVIAAKKQAIVGVLETLPSKWYEDALVQAGFVEVVVVHSKLGFVTWMARKPGQCTSMLLR